MYRVERSPKVSERDPRWLDVSKFTRFVSKWKIIGCAARLSRECAQHLHTARKKSRDQLSVSHHPFQLPSPPPPLPPPSHIKPGCCRWPEISDEISIFIHAFRRKYASVRPRGKAPRSTLHGCNLLCINSAIGSRIRRSVLSADSTDAIVAGSW